MVVRRFEEIMLSDTGNIQINISLYKNPIT